MPGEHPEYSLGFAFSLLLSEILFVPEVGLHLIKVHSSNGGKGIFGNRRGRVCRCLLCGSGSNFSDVFGAIGPVTASMKLALAALVLWLSAVFDAVTFSSAVETLVVSWRRISLAFTLFLLIPREGTNVFFDPWSKPYLRRFYLIESFAGTRFLTCSCVHVVCLQV